MLKTSKQCHNTIMAIYLELTKGWLFSKSLNFGGLVTQLIVKTNYQNHAKIASNWCKDTCENLRAVKKIFCLQVAPKYFLRTYFASWTELGQSSVAYFTSSLRHRAHLFLSRLSTIIDCSVTSGGIASDSRLKSNGRPESQ